MNTKRRKEGSNQTKKTEEKKGAGDMEIEGHINRENRDLGLTEADTMC